MPPSKDHKLVLKYIEDAQRREKDSSANIRDLYDLARENQKILGELTGKMAAIEGMATKIDRTSGDIGKLRVTLTDQIHNLEMRYTTAKAESEVRVNGKLTEVKRCIDSKIKISGEDFTSSIALLIKERIKPLEDEAVNNEKQINRFKNIAIGIAIGSGLAGGGISYAAIRLIVGP